MLGNLSHQLGRYRNRFEQTCYRSNEGREIPLDVWTLILG